MTKMNQAYVTFKVNGHLQKIRKVYLGEILKQIEDFIAYFIKDQQKNEKTTKDNANFKAKGNININIKPIISDLVSEDCFQTF